MLKTYMKNTSVLHIKDFDEGRNELLADVLLGEVLCDETNRYPKGLRTMTSPILCSNGREFKTKSGSLYITEGQSQTLTISAKEWYVMRQNILSHH
jgi:hypothetical protein